MTKNHHRPHQRPKIAMFSIHSDPLASLGGQESGGQNVYVRSLVEGLTRLGWDVDVFTRWDSLQKKRIAHINKHARVVRLKGGAVTYIPKSELFDFFPEIFDNFLHFIGTTNPYSLFHSHYWDGGALGVMAKEKFHIPLVHIFHSLGITRIETRKKFLKDESEQGYFSKRLNMENKIIKSSDKIIVLSQSEKEDLEKFYACPSEKIAIIPGGVNLRSWKGIQKEKARQYLLIKPEEFVALFVGRFEWRKGMGTLINAAALLRKHIPNLRFILVGGKIFGRNKNEADLKEYSRLKEMVQAMKLEKIVTFTGSVENRALSNYYRVADVFIIPSYYEPFGLVALEGMANKVPVIASNVGGLANIIKHQETGLLFEPRDPHDLCKKILSIYTAKETATAFTEKAYAAVSQQYSWDMIISQINQKYQELLQQQ